jgi:hypothetical protein
MVAVHETALDKSLKEMLKEFHVLRMQVNTQSNSQAIAEFKALKESLLLALEQKELESQAELERSKTRKNMLAKKLWHFEQHHDEKMRNEIIKEMEEYSRIKRFRYAQLASIQRNIDDIKKQ